MQAATTTQPLSVYLSVRWNLENPQISCPAWNGTDFLPDAAAHTASIARVQPDQAKLDAYVAKVCAGGAGAGATLNSDLLAGGPTAQLAFLATTQSCTAGASTLANQASACNRGLGMRQQPSLQSQAAVPHGAVP